MKSGKGPGLWLAVWLLSGCVAGPLDPGRYTCEPDGGEAQCPGSWRCGLEGYCHKLGDVSTRWKCENDDHCENGWTCGLNADRTQGECHDPAVGQPHPCLADSHCTSGWHCGLAAQCQDRDAGAAYLCRSDAGLDDSWCERGWRCAPEGLCVDPAKDSLGAVGLLAAGQATKIHPLINSGPLQRFAVSPFYESGLGFGLQTIAWVQNNELFARVTVKRGPPTSINYALGNWNNSTALAVLGSRGEYSEFDYSQDDKTRLYVVRANGDIDVITLALDGGAERQAVETLYPATRLTLGTSEGSLAPRVISFNPAGNSYHRLRGAPVAIFDSDFVEEETKSNFPRDGGNYIVDAVSVRPSQFMECVFAADQRGLFVAQRAYGMGSHPTSVLFEPIEVPLLTNDACQGRPATQRITGLAPYGRDWLGVSSTGLDGGASNVTILDLRQLWTRNETDAFCSTAAGFPCDDFDRIPVASRVGPCPVCLGGQLLDFSLVVDPLGQPNIEARCGSSDGGTSGFVVVSRRTGTGECTRTNAEGESGLFAKSALLRPEQPVPGQVAWASPDGFIWTGSSSASVTSNLFDRAATAVVRRAEERSTLMVFTGDVAASFEPGVGFSAAGESQVLAGVSDAPAWALTRDRTVVNLANSASIADGKALAVLGNQVNAFSPPYFAASARGSDAGVLVVAAGNSIFSAEVDPTQSTPAPLNLKVVSPSQIDSLAFPQKPTAGAYLQGYAVTPNGVLRLVAQTSSRWIFSEVSLPGLLVPKEVWFENDRGRVGFTDGTVFSLPSRVQIAGPLPEGVVDYAQVCGQQLALGSSKLYRLEPVSGKSVGEWKEVALPVGFAGPGAFLRGRVHSAGSTAYVFKRSGETAELPFATCPAP